MLLLSWVLVKNEMSDSVRKLEASTRLEQKMRQRRKRAGKSRASKPPQARIKKPTASTSVPASLGPPFVPVRIRNHAPRARDGGDDFSHKTPSRETTSSTLPARDSIQLGQLAIGSIPSPTFLVRKTRKCAWYYS